MTSYPFREPLVAISRFDNNSKVILSSKVICYYRRLNCCKCFVFPELKSDPNDSRTRDRRGWTDGVSSNVRFVFSELKFDPDFWRTRDRPGCTIGVRSDVFKNKNSENKLALWEICKHNNEHKHSCNLPFYKLQPIFYVCITFLFTIDILSLNLFLSYNNEHVLTYIVTNN